MVLRASISLKADTTYVVPVAAVDYIYMRAVPALDASGRFRIIFESATVTDQSNFLLSKPRAHSVALSDDSFIDAGKALADTASIGDSLSALLLFLREFSDTTSVADATSLVITYPRQEGVVIAEDEAFNTTKLIVDGFAMNDDADAIDGLQHSIGKGISNVAFANDSSSLIFAASRVESVSVPDAGLVLAQGYAELSYFAEDYVGVSQSF
jgi:hypothetical protein